MGRTDAIRQREARRSGPLFTWAPLLLVSVLLVALLRQVLEPIIDPDTYWHLRLGEYVATRHVVRGPEPWSRFAENEQVLNQWGSELLFRGVFQVASYPGLVALQAVLPVVLLLVLYGCCRQFGRIAVASICAATGWLAASDGLQLRPQILSFILLALVTTLWLKSVDDDQVRWWLIPLTWVWACLHGLWLTGIAVGACVVVGMFLDRQRPLRRTGLHALVVVGSLVAAALTPVGPTLVLRPSGMTAYAQFVSEWAPPELLTLRSGAALGMAALIVVIWARRPSAPSWAHIGVLIVATAWALLYSRTVAIGGVMLAPLTAKVLAESFEELHRIEKETRWEWVPLTAATLVFAVTSVLMAPAVSREAVPYPKGLTNELTQMPAGTAVLNDYSLGGWMLWNHPSLDPYIDGRADVYSLRHFDRYKSILLVKPGWDRMIDDDHVYVALLNTASPLADAMLRSGNWRVLGQDAGFSLMRRAP